MASTRSARPRRRIVSRSSPSRSTSASAASRTAARVSGLFRSRSRRPFPLLTVASFFDTYAVSILTIVARVVKLVLMPSPTYLRALEEERLTSADRLLRLRLAPALVLPAALFSLRALGVLERYHMIAAQRRGGPGGVRHLL